MVQVWRLNINTGAEKGVDPREFCLTRGLLGVGWMVEHHSALVEWETYEALARVIYYDKGDKGWWPALNALKNKMRIGDLCWTRDWDGRYYLGRALSEWRFENKPEHIAADIVNVRDCEWKDVGMVDCVPGKVSTSFSRGRTLQKIDDHGVRVFSMLTFNLKSEGKPYFIERRPDASLFSFLSPTDCEDVVGMYLQLKKGYHLVPSSCKLDTPKYEYVLKHGSTGDSAVVQVKAGRESIRIQDYSGLADRVFLFSAHGGYEGTNESSIECLSPSELEAFVRDNLRLLPQSIQRWIEVTDEVRGVRPN